MLWLIAWLIERLSYLPGWFKRNVSDGFIFGKLMCVYWYLFLVENIFLV
ncbi:hypothetical protein SAMN05421820_11684 [Pedobacter steynii]|uniref:Uncharacterized protein n=1 Tax=Pedobacter steynii TaxID=430522 RepID=A0A1H0KL68_9SPHI|nr:hypothetical protein SAMN05421820_11684 [Pedobacter steynii]